MAHHLADKKDQKASRNLRLFILVSVLVVTTGIGLGHQLLKQVAPVGIDALCPFGAIEGAYSLIATGVIFKRIAVSNFILFGAVVASAVVFRRAFCGVICPLGTLQELVSKVGARWHRGKPRVPPVIDRPARYLKYAVLAVTVVFSAITAQLVIRPYDPWVAYHHLFSSDLFAGLTAGFVILVLLLLGSVLYTRVFCKYACPMGAFLALFRWTGLLTVRRNAATCTDCKVCDKVCQVNIKVSARDLVNDAECLNCTECVNVCPVKDTLYIGATRGAKLAPTKVLGIVAAVFVVIVGATSVTRDFQWTTTSLTEEIQAVGQFDTSLIKGRMTLGEVADAAGISRSVLRDKFQVTDGELEIPIKDLAGKYGFEAEEVRVFVKERLAITVSP